MLVKRKLPFFDKNRYTGIIPVVEDNTLSFKTVTGEPVESYEVIALRSKDNRMKTFVYTPSDIELTNDKKNVYADTDKIRDPSIGDEDFNIEELKTNVMSDKGPAFYILSTDEYNPHAEEEYGEIDESWGGKRRKTRRGHKLKRKTRKNRRTRSSTHGRHKTRFRRVRI